MSSVDFSNIISQDGVFNYMKAGIKDLENNNIQAPLFPTNYDTTLDNYYNAFLNQGNQNTVVLSDQAKVAEILNIENERLQEKKKNVDIAYSSRMRAAMLNENYRLRYTEYTKIIILFVITLVVIGGLIMFKKSFSFVPPFLIDFFIIVIGTLSLITGIYIYLGILARDKIYFNEIVLPPPPKKLPTLNPSATVNNNNKNSEFLMYGMCVGADCCTDPNLTYDANKARCVPRTSVATYDGNYNTPTPTGSM
jgi:hypothetical protein